jgi:hypothetical protein
MTKHQLRITNNKCRFLLLVSLCLASSAPLALADVLIVADEFPAMEFLRTQLQKQEKVQSTVVSQKNLPPFLTPFDTVIGYIHGGLSNSAERAFIDYTEAGGKLLLLHHSISSGKRKNQDWFKFLGVSLPEGNVTNGGYKWIEGVTWDLDNLNPNHFITTNRVSYPKYFSSEKLSGFTLTNDEVYLNHVLSGPRTLLMGFSYHDLPTGRTWRQETAGWIKAAAKGWIIYLMPGHSIHDFENPAYQQIVLNAVMWKPQK